MQGPGLHPERQPFLSCELSSLSVIGLCGRDGGDAGGFLHAPVCFDSFITKL